MECEQAARAEHSAVVAAGIRSTTHVPHKPVTAGSLDGEKLAPAVNSGSQLLVAGCAVPASHAGGRGFRSCPGSAPRSEQQAPTSHQPWPLDELLRALAAARVPCLADAIRAQR
jgi:hypothetical protein